MVVLEAVWLFAELTMGLMALVNLIAIVLLAKWATDSLSDWERQRRAGRTPVFHVSSPDLPAALDPVAWGAGLGDEDEADGAAPFSDPADRMVTQ
jgi:AGCS family alanine or glycine:cation symporter